ncbi:MAG TPA: DMT family transporter [Alphaproteobacteria bacterium]|nr:DMT family transporter [Alphaproteobacteria bacterium]
MKPAEARLDDPVGGSLLLVGAMLLFSLSDASSKILAQSLPVLEIAWLRYLAFVLLVAPATARQGLWSFYSPRPMLQAWRGLGLLGSGLLFIWALRYLPMADATATGFVSPLFTTALSIPFLGEKVGIRRWAAVVIGLLGVIIIVRPGTSAFNPASAFPILSAASWSLAMVITRRMSGTDSTITMLAYAAVVGFLALSAALPFVWVTPNLEQLALAGFIGLASTGGQWLTVKAYRRADASLLAPLSYLQLVWSTLLGFLVFSAIPDHATILGAAIIVASGIYTAHRERIVAARRLAGRG